MYIYVFQNNKKFEILEDKRKENIKKYDSFIQTSRYIVVERGIIDNFI